MLNTTEKPGTLEVATAFASVAVGIMLVAVGCTALAAVTYTLCRVVWRTLAP